MPRQHPHPRRKPPHDNRAVRIPSDQNARGSKTPLSSKPARCEQHRKRLRMIDGSTTQINFAIELKFRRPICNRLATVTIVDHRRAMEIVSPSLNRSADWNLDVDAIAVLELVIPVAASNQGVAAMHVVQMHVARKWLAESNRFVAMKMPATAICQSLIGMTRTIVGTRSTGTGIKSRCAPNICCGGLTVTMFRRC